jgi:thioredoxin-related protein
VIGTIFAMGSCSAGNSEEKSQSSTEKINWLSYDAGIKKAAEENKIIVLDFYTTWCKFCVKMDKETFSQKEIIDYFNENFIAIKVNAESKKKIDLPTGAKTGVELARSFGVRGYPSHWFLKPNLEKITNLPGYSPAEKFIHIITFIGDGHYENTKFEDYMKQATSAN